MIFNVAGLLMGDIGGMRQHNLENERLDTEYASFQDITGPVRTLRTDRTILVTAEIQAHVWEYCSRCLEPAMLQLTGDLEEEFHPLNSDLMGIHPGDVETNDPFDQVFMIDERNNLDLTEALRQTLTGIMPIAPLCQPECAGICPTCSTNRNEHSCDCERDITDSRWDALAGLTSRVANSDN
ncbi:MAG: DUF177 domain-containing protein [Dehalococcoidia bacterium]